MDVPRLIRTHVTTGDLDPPQDLVNALNDGSIALSEIVKGLGQYLTSTEDDVRLKGLTFLANTIPLITPAKVNRPATQTLTSFFLAKLDDFDSLLPALQALKVLSKLPTFDDTAAVEVYQGLAEQVNLKSYVQATRYQAYALVDSLLAFHRKAFIDMGADFLNSYTKMVDGEKDPRNLMLLFSMDRVILLEFNVIDHMEDMFDITFCYFPIMFKPPPNDPYGITADDLKLALRDCMSASPHFAKMALPLFLEKFSSVTGQAMKDLLLSMAACFPVYGPVAVKERGTELWEGIKTEIMYSSDLAIEAAALSSLESLVRTLYPTSSDAPSGLAQVIIKQSLEVLAEPEKSQALAATKILAALIRASPSAGTFALSQALPQLFRQFNQPALPSHRTPILSAVSSLIFAARSVYGAADTTRHERDEKSLEPFREGIMDILREGLRTTDLKTPAIKGSVSLVEIPGFLGKEEIGELVKGMNDTLINDKDPETRTSVIKGLTSISTVHPSIIESVTLPLLFHNLPDRAPGLAATEEREKYRSILHSLTELCVQPALFETLVVRITTKLDLLSTPNPSAPVTEDDDMSDVKETTDDRRECEVAFVWDLLNCLAAVIDAKVKAKHVDVAKHFDRIIPRLYGLVITAAAPSLGDREPLFRDRRLLNIVSKITEMLMWELSVDRQSKQLAAVYSAFEKGELGGIIQDPSTLTGPSASPLRSGASISEQNLISLYSSTLQGAKADCIDPATSPDSFLSSKVQWTIHRATDSFQVRWALDLITAYVNKRDRDLKGALEGILEAIWVKEVIDTEQPFETRKRGLQAYQHITKALSLLRHPLAYTAVERVIAILKLSNFDPDFVDEAARSFSILAEGKGKGKEKTSRLTSKLLFAQKLWNHVLPRLIEGDKEASGRDRIPYLVAFASLLPLVPASLCLAELSTIFPLLVRSLSLGNSAQRINTIITIISILETQNLSADVDTLLHQHAVVLVEALLKCFLPEDPMAESSGKVRATALRCLAIVPDAIRFDSLRTKKSEVLRDLGKALDDPLRPVRKEAVECRARWYRYGTAA